MTTLARVAALLEQAAALLRAEAGESTISERAPAWSEIPPPERPRDESLSAFVKRPEPHEIHAAWSSIMATGPGQCWACLETPHRSHLHRAHILAHARGGSADPLNFHILCSRCHLASEHMQGVDYWRWFARRRGWRWPLAGGPT